MTTSGTDFILEREIRSKEGVSQGLWPRIPRFAWAEQIWGGQFACNLVFGGCWGFRQVPASPGGERVRAVKAALGAQARHPESLPPRLRPCQPDHFSCGAPCESTRRLVLRLSSAWAGDTRMCGSSSRSPQVQPSDEAGGPPTSGFCYSVTHAASAQAGSWGYPGRGTGLESEAELPSLCALSSAFPPPHPHLLQCQISAESRPPKRARLGVKEDGGEGPGDLRNVA